jgi:hypothetical protein
VSDHEGAVSNHGAVRSVRGAGLYLIRGFAAVGASNGDGAAPNHGAEHPVRGAGLYLICGFAAWV